MCKGKIPKIDLTYDLRSLRADERNGNDVVWRYMDFEKLKNLLDNQALYFRRIDKFEDKWDGKPTKASLDKIVIQYDVPSRSEEEKTIIKKIYETRDRIYVSCWHKNEDENYAMWKSYVSKKEGIAIRTKLSTIRLALNKGLRQDGFKEHKFKIGNVCYVKPEIYKNPSPNVRVPFCLMKRLAFSFENEVRVLVETAGDGSFTRSDFEGLYASCDLSILFAIDNTEVYIKPGSGDRFGKKVEQLLRRHNLDPGVVKLSCLDEPPLDYSLISEVNP